MRNSTAFFAGVTTVFSATALGFAGAMMLTTATPQSPTEHTKLERSVAPPAQAAQSADPKPAQSADPKPITSTNSSGTTEIANQSPAAPAAVAEPRQPPQQAATTSPPPQVQPGPSAEPKASAAEQSAASSQVTSASNAYARGSDEDIKKYVRKRERHWAHRHYRDDNATTGGQDPKSVDKDDKEQSPASENQTASQGQTQPAQTKKADQTATKVDDTDSGKVKRKHDRRWTRAYSRDSGERGHDEARAPSFEVREMPREDAPQTFFGTPRWRPLFSDSDDDD
jgi:hypothetical protein